MADVCTDTSIQDAILANAAGPKRVKVANQEVESHGLKDQVEADAYLKGKCAANRAHQGLRFTKLIPPGGG